MSKPECELLDAYLLGWLSAEDAAAFESHLAGCAECAKQKELQQRIDAATDGARSEPEPAPALLVARIERRVRLAHRWRLVRITCGLAAAALLAVIPGKSWLSGKRAGIETEPARLVAQNETPPTPVAAVPQPRVRLVDPSSAILVPMPSKNSDVTIVWVYPTWKPGDGSQ